MQSFDQGLMQLVKQELITYDEALKHVTNPDDFALRFRGIGSTSDGTWEGFEDGEEEKDDLAEAMAEADGGTKPPGSDDDFIERF
jgi:twitching motility protein PilT